MAFMYPEAGRCGLSTDNVPPKQAVSLLIMNHYWLVEEYCHLWKNLCMKGQICCQSGQFTMIVIPQACHHWGSSFLSMLGPWGDHHGCPLPNVSSPLVPAIVIDGPQIDGEAFMQA